MNTQDLVAKLYSQGVSLSVDRGDLLLDGAVDAGLLALVREHKAAIITLLGTLARARAAHPLVPAQRGPAYEAPASLAQQRMLFMEELAGDSSYYNIPSAFDIAGPLDVAALQHAFDQLVATHDILRTVYRSGGQVQRVLAPQPVALNYTELTGGAAQLAVLLAEEAQYRVDLQREPPLRVRLFKVGSEHHVLAIMLHHIAADGWSARRIIGDLGDLYAGAVPAAATFQYADYAELQARWEQGEECQAARTYWTQTLAGAPQTPVLPTDFVRPQMQNVAGDTAESTIGADLARRLESFARSLRTTPFVLFQAAFAALVARYSGETDIVFGTAAANRQPAEFLDTVGLFVNTLVLRYQVGDELNFEQLARQAATVSDAAFRHQQFAFDALVDALQPVRSPAYNPLVQLMLVMQDRPATLSLEGTQVSERVQRQPVAKFDLALHVHPGAGAFALRWEFNTSLFERATIEAMAGHFNTLLAACLADPQLALARIALLPPAAAPQAAAAAPQCIHRLFEAQAARAPQAVALLDGGTAVSYAELDRRATLVASHLAAAGALPRQRIGVCMEKCAELVVSMLAIFKLGAVYVPLDPHYPQQRRDFMASDAALSFLLAGSAAPQAGPAPVLQVAALLAQQCAHPAPQADDSAAGAYVIYTSGSTGQPKGVLVSHANLFHSLQANLAATQMGAQDVMPTIGSQAFGVSLLEILLPLVSGGAVQIVHKAQVVDMDRLLAATADVTVLHAVPSLMRQWLEAVSTGQASYPGLRLLLVGGESVSDTLLRQIRQWRPEVRLLALYGMTESTIVCSSFEPDQRMPARYCIGTPYAHASFQVLNRQGQLQPRGVPGELHIGGPSVAVEYINQPEMTAERFIDAAGQRLYRTGDRVRLLDGGAYEFLGRIDHQVSLRGARIELGEIETAAAGVEGVRQAVAHVAELGADDSTLVLYYSAAGHLGEQIRAALAERLPDYMRPAIIQRLEQFPLNPNGKVDRKRLPRPEFEQVIEAPVGALEQRLAQLWCDVLQCDSVGATTSFFEAGGHSLMATRLATRIRAEFEVAFPLSVLFMTPTIRAAAAHIAAEQAGRMAASLIRDSASVDPDREELIL